MSKKPKHCEYPGCTEKERQLTLNRGDWGDGSKLQWYCLTHADEIVAKGNPEYIVGCPNCNCQFGVN